MHYRRILEAPPELERGFLGEDDYSFAQAMSDSAHANRLNVCDWQAPDTALGAADFVERPPAHPPRVPRQARCSTGTAAGRTWHM